MIRKNVWMAFVMLCFSVLFMSCGDNQYEKILAKKWKPTFNAQKEIKDRAKKHFAKMGEKHIAKLKKGIEQKATQMVFDFKADGKYTIVFEKDGEPETGTWKVIEGGKVLFIKSDRGKQQKITIQSLSETKAVLKINETQELILLPV